MNILLVNWQDLENPQAGGAEIHLFELFGRLTRRGHRVHLVCSGWRGCPPTATIDGVSVERHGDRHTFALRGRGAVRAALRRQAWDVLVEDVNKLPLYTATMTRIPSCVIVPHLFGTTAYHEAGWVMASAVVLAERLMPRAYRRSAFHTISESTRDDLIARGIPAERIEVIHPGVDYRRFHPDPALDRSKPPSFLYVGRLKRYKGVDLAIRALSLVHRTRPDVRLDIAGSGDDRPRLEGVVTALGLTNRVTFHGFVTEEAKLELLRTTWANLFPSPKEGWGITVMEAAACGTPSIASNSPGLRDSVRDGHTGHLVPHGDVEQLARRMLELVEHPDRVAALGRAARAHAEAWSWDDAAAATERHLSSLAGH
ncbi:MAG: glycosyltransferase family 4 protein [Gemmatimonadales bacterium]|nr:glycosyltransferase family 4 protein [Gemmatimonadales bacterium]